MEGPADPELRDALFRAAEIVRSGGGRALLVGGAVRDAQLGRPLRDADVEVFGLDLDALQALLAPVFGLDLVGRDFPVLKLRGRRIDISLPRRAHAPGEGLAGLRREADPGMDPETALARRDFTVNAMAWDPLSGELLDPFGGRADLEAGVLRHASDRFGEDPLRVLRGMQLVARFELEPAPETVALCRTLGPEGLAKERVFEEWRKLVVHGRRPSRGLAFLRDTGWLRHTPELLALVDCPQDPEWHPEGDVWIHTLHCMDVFADERVGDAREDLIVGLAVLCHDLGKPDTTREEDGRITSKRHDRAGEELTRSFLLRMTHEKPLVEEVVPLVGAHLAPVMLHEAGAGAAAIRRLARRVGRIDRLVRVASADQKGRPPLVISRFEAGEWLLQRARALEVERAAPTPILQGRHLLALGAAPGPALGPLLRRCYDAQIEGVFSDLEGGLAHARRLLAEADA